MTSSVELLTKDTVIGDLLKIDVQLARFLMEIGMHCIGCPASRGETLEQACMVHGADVDELLARMNAYLEVERGAE